MEGAGTESSRNTVMTKPGEPVVERHEYGQEKKDPAPLACVEAMRWVDLCIGTILDFCMRAQKTVVMFDMPSSWLVAVLAFA